MIQKLKKKKKINEFFAENWLSFITYRSIEYKNYFYKSCLKDIKNNLSFQTEGFVKSCFYGDYLTFNHLYHREFVDIDTRQFYGGRTPFMLSSQSNHIKIVEKLLSDKKVDVNIFDDDHKTSLYHACENNYYELVYMFLNNNNNKVDINMPDKNGKSPFFIACEKGYYDIVKLFLDRKDAILNSQCVNSNSPFGLAVENWHYKVVKLLIDSNKIRFTYKNEENPLYRACLRGSLKMVELLFSMKNKEIDINQIDDICLC